MRGGQAGGKAGREGEQISFLLKLMCNLCSTTPHHLNFHLPLILVGGAVCCLSPQWSSLGRPYGTVHTRPRGRYPAHSSPTSATGDSPPPPA